MALSASRPLVVAGSRPFRWFYVGWGIALVVMAIIGFWEFYGLWFAEGAPPADSRHWARYLHSSAFLVWIALFAFQSALVRVGRPDLHRYFGPAFAAYGFAVVIAGLASGLSMATRRYRESGMDAGAWELYFVLGDMSLFAAFLTAAVLLRRRPEAHQRLMFFATMALGMVGLSAFLRRVLPAESPSWLFELLRMAPFLLAVAYDLATRRRVHVVTLIGLAIFFVKMHFGAELTMVWMETGHDLMQVLAQ